MDNKVGKTMREGKYQNPKKMFDEIKTITCCQKIN